MGSFLSLWKCCSHHNHNLILPWKRQWCFSRLSGDIPATLEFSLSCTKHPRNEAAVGCSVSWKLQGSPQDLTPAEGSYFKPHFESLTHSLYSCKTSSCVTGCCLGLSDKLWPLEEQGGQESAEIWLFVVWDSGVQTLVLKPKVHHTSPKWGSGDASAGEAWEKLPEIPHVSCTPKSQTLHWKPGGHYQVLPTWGWS